MVIGDAHLKSAVVVVCDDPPMELSIHPGALHAWTWPDTKMMEMELCGENKVSGDKVFTSWASSSTFLTVKSPRRWVRASRLASLLFHIRFKDVAF